MSTYHDPRGDTVDELEQEEVPTAPLPVVPVAVQGPVRTRSLPTRTASPRSTTLNPGQVFQVAGNDPRRASLRVWLVDFGGAAAPGRVLIGGDEHEAKGGGGAILPPGGDVLPFGHTEAVWLYNQDSAFPATVSWVVELWAD